MVDIEICDEPISAHNLYISPTYEEELIGINFIRMLQLWDDCDIKEIEYNQHPTKRFFKTFDHYLLYEKYRNFILTCQERDYFNIRNFDYSSQIIFSPRCLPHTSWIVNEHNNQMNRFRILLTENTLLLPDLINIIIDYLRELMRI
jgi:hypothetical protein